MGPGKAWEIEWRNVIRLDFGHGVCIHYCGSAAEPSEPGPLVAFVVGFEWRRGDSHVLVEVLRDDHPVWNDVDVSQSEVRQEIGDVVAELLNGGSMLLRRGRLRVIANA